MEYGKPLVEDELEGQRERNAELGKRLDELGPLPSAVSQELRRMKIEGEIQDMAKRAEGYRVGDVAIVEVVQVVFNRGAGVEKSPIRNVTQWWLDGKLIGEEDPCPSGE